MFALLLERQTRDAKIDRVEQRILVYAQFSSAKRTCLSARYRVRVGRRDAVHTVVQGRAYPTNELSLESVFDTTIYRMLAENIRGGAVSQASFRSIPALRADSLGFTPKSVEI